MNFSLTVILSVLILTKTVLSRNECQTKRLDDVKSGITRVHGSSLGSWFVLESWMSPKPWDNNNCSKDTYPGSYLLEKCLGNRAPQVLENHWSTFITEADFSEMSTRGVNAVRLPVGWWQIYDPEGGAAKAHLNYHINPKNYTVGGLKYIDKAFEWGQKYGIGIILTMHAAPGSQNGNDHSSPAYPKKIYWDQYPANVAQTVDSMGLYAQRFANHQALVGFGLLNEPANVNITILQDYYKRAYQKIREFSRDAWIVLNPLIAPFESGTESHWTGFMNESHTHVVMDLHYYSCFGGPPDQTNPDLAIRYINYDRRNQIKDYEQKNPKKLLIGEWSACGHFSVDRAKDFTQAQINVYNNASFGWTFWSWTNGATNNVWSLKTAFNQGWLQPQYPC